MDRLKKSISSNLDALIEKFRTETNRQSEEDFINTRRLTTESPNKPPDMVPSHDIDRQITDLESLIKRLQDEIIEMANDADKPIKEDLTELFTKAHYNLENSDDSQNADQNSTTTSKNSDSDQTNSHVFPVIIPNTSPLNADQHKNNSPDDFTTVNTPNASNLTATFANTRKNFALLQDDVEDDIVTEKAEDVKPSTTNETFEDLRAEIMAKVISEATGLPLNDSEEDL